MELRELQQDFFGYLLAEEANGIVQQIESTPMLSANQRMGVYANAYVLRLKEALETDYEVLHSYLGDEQFDQLCTDFIRQHPSHTHSLRYYSQALPAMLRDSEPYKAFPELHEIALIEQSFANSFDAKDTQIASLEQLADLPPEHWPDLKLEFTPSQQLLSLHTNSFELWKALSQEQTPPEVINSETTQHWVIWRKADLISHFRPLEAPEFAALTAAINGESFAGICETLLVFFSEEQVPTKAVGYLQNWIGEERARTVL